MAVPWFTTHLGCTISLVPTGEGARARLGDGVLLCLDMKQDEDGRHAEVHLSPDDLRALVTLLNPEVSHGA